MRSSNWRTGSKPASLVRGALLLWITMGWSKKSKQSCGAEVSGSLGAAGAVCRIIVGLRASRKTSWFKKLDCLGGLHIRFQRIIRASRRGELILHSQFSVLRSSFGPLLDKRRMKNEQR